MKKVNFNHEIEESVRIENITNALWLKVFADQLSRTASNNLSNIYDKLSIDKQSINVVLDACDDLMSNDRSQIPHYLEKLCIDDANVLKNWLKYLKDRDILSDEDVELLMCDYEDKKYSD